MSSYRFSHFESEIKNLEFSETCIWIIHSNKIPPHIGISVNKEFFSLKATGKDEKLPVKEVFESLNKKHIEFVIIQTIISLEPLEIEREYKKYKHAIPNEVSCIFPILELLGLDKSLLLVNLINYLEENRLVKNVFAFNIKREFLEIGVYSATDVALEIEKLQRVKRRKS